MRIIRIAALIFAGFLFTHSYFWFAWITVGFSFFWNAVLPQFEAATLFHLKTEPHRYSQIRLWGSFGFIVTVLTIGRLLDSQPIVVLPLVITALLILSWCVTLITPQAHAISDGSAPVSLLHLLKKPEVLAFFVVYMLLQVAHTPYYVFYSIYLNHYHYTGTLTGVLWALGVLAEIFLFI